jgi:hypothetical protein
MSAFYTDNDDILAPAFQKVLEAPALAEGGVFVTEQVMSVEKIHDRVLLLPLGIALGKINMELPDCI